MSPVRGRLAAVALALALLAGCALLPGVGPRCTDANPCVRTGVVNHVSQWEPLHEVIPSITDGSAALQVALVDTNVLFGIEGAVFFVQGTTFDGTLVLDRRVGLDGLRQPMPPGDYELRAYARTCDANCGYLDEPGDLCSASLSLTDGTKAQLVVSLAGRACSVTAS